MGSSSTVGAPQHGLSMAVPAAKSDQSSAVFLGGRGRPKTAAVDFCRRFAPGPEDLPQLQVLE